MILRRLSRPGALLVAFVAMLGSLFALALTIGPIVAILLGLLSGGMTDPLDALGEMYATLFRFEWLWRAFGSDGEILVLLAIPAFWSGIQVLFLSPIVGPPATQEQGRSLVPSVVAVSLLGSAGCAMLWVGGIEAILALVTVSESDFGALYGLVMGAAYLMALGVWIGGGFLWYSLIRRSGARRDPAGLDRLVRWLFAGTAVEAGLGALFFVAVRRRTGCFCVMASFLSLLYAALVLFWLCGPWVVLLATRAERAKWARSACRECGYPRRSDAEICTECGHRFAVERRTDPS